MNLVDAFVKKVISEPYEEYGKWWIDVEYISWGVPGKTRLMFESKEQALEGKRKLTAVCSHQTRIGNLDAHLI